MKARDVMVYPVITVRSRSSLKAAIKTFLDCRISAVPVVDAKGKLVGMIGESDLLRRSCCEPVHRPWWLKALAGDKSLAADFATARRRKVASVMTRDVITATPDTPVGEIAVMLLKHHIKRVPIVDDDGALVGLVSRANLIQAIAGIRPDDEEVSDTAIREMLLANLKSHHWDHTPLLNITVTEGVVDLWGMTESGTERRAICVAAESIPGVRMVKDNLVMRPAAMDA
jgi:CBS domain-containing protein